MKMNISDIKETFGAFVEALQEKHPNLAYLHVVRSRIGGSTDVVPQGDQEETLDFLVCLPALRMTYFVARLRDSI